LNSVCYPVEKVVLPPPGTAFWDGLQKFYFLGLTWKKISFKHRIVDKKYAAALFSTYRISDFNFITIRFCGIKNGK